MVAFKQSANIVSLVGSGLIIGSLVVSLTFILVEPWTNAPAQSVSQVSSAGTDVRPYDPLN